MSSTRTAGTRGPRRDALAEAADVADALPPDASSTAQLRRQVVDLYRRGALPPLLSLLCACGLAGLLWPDLSVPKVVAWLGVHGAVSVGRGWLARRFTRQRVAETRLAQWRTYYVNSALVAGLAWGIGSVLLVAGSGPKQQLLTWLVLVAAVLVEFAPLARLGRAFGWLLIATLTAPLALSLLGPQAAPAAAGGLLLLAFSSALAGAELYRTYTDGILLQVEFARLARFDQLTGLANRRHFDETLAGEWQRALRQGGEVALIIFDVDHFKRYNDHFGHPAGDTCLRRLAAAARDLVHRPSDLVVRMGGEEFAVLLPQTPASGATAIADMLRLAIENLRLPHASAAGQPFVTISVGVASLRPDSGLHFDDLVKAADAALYQAKAAGRNRVMTAPEPERASAAAQRLRGVMS
ncbi:MAG: diguanylate cyclase [Immundisolibacter sp.]|uniref:GGDEF domain-containing protein n=1 Tax=Immundisolibacter sp. TaxID=1934948 RepID=UPI003D0EEC31